MYRMEIPGWRPASVNRLMGHWSKRSRLKHRDRRVVAVAGLVFAVPRAAGKRRLTVLIRLENMGHAPDPDNVYKSLLDALVHCRLLVDDSADYVELGSVHFDRGPNGTSILLEELP